MNNTDQQDNKIRRILERIEKNELVSRPKSFFALRLAGFALTLIAVMIVSIFLWSFMSFSIHSSGHASLIGFGPSGFRVFLSLFPWKLLALEIVLITLLEYLVSSFRFAYKIPILYLILGVLGFMVVSGVIVDQTPLHSDLLRMADQHHLPRPFQDLYEGARRPPSRDSGIFQGTVIAVDDSYGTSTDTTNPSQANGPSLIVALDNPSGTGTTTDVTVYLTQPDNNQAKTDIDNGNDDSHDYNGTQDHGGDRNGNGPAAFQQTLQISDIQVGDEIFIHGDIHGNVIQADNIKNANDALPPPHDDGTDNE